MWIYEKKLQHPVRVSGPDLAFAKVVITQYGGGYHIWYILTKYLFILY